MEPLSTVHASADDSSHLQSLLDLLSMRIDTFEQELHEAITAERTFRRSLQTVSHALDGFVESHRQEDMQLSQLIAEDTQRSRETKEEYDALAARFDAAFRGNGSTTRREIVATVWLYVGIVLSVVFIAPVHLIVSIVDGVVRRVGYGTEGYNGGRSGARERQRRRIRGRGEAAGKKRRGRDDDEKGRSGVEVRDQGKGAEKYNGKDRTEEAATVKKEEEEGEEEEEVEEEQSGSDEDDVFVDAVSGEEKDVKRRARVRKRGTRSRDTMSGTSASGTMENERRPDWARIGDDDGESGVVEEFPSNEFWNICDDDLRIESLRKEETEG